LNPINPKQAATNKYIDGVSNKIPTGVNTPTNEISTASSARGISPNL
jgi:hypothetical protein